ncbi:coiled-coil domain-containing protein 50-like isoform X2 [Anguilla rostrata]|uniref:coiled-coil domain-containing protein 50-like isoform X2 n=1 Tax=Anguilla rostrata TaxID=7938 RepID=UPI0030CCB087
MADLSIDQDNLPGVKEVCRDFAVLEDHCLAYSLQEQEIESHLASNVHKSRLIQTDLRVAKRIQEEEDVQAKALTQRHQRAIEQSDVEIAHGIQDQLVRQAMQQRQQEEKDAEIARKLQKQMIKEEKKMSKKIKKLQGSTSVEPYDWMAGSDYSVQNVTQGVKQMGLREQELHDMEVARRLQEEELKASLADSRAAQVAQDEEIARMLMEKEKKKACKSSKKWGRKNPDGEWRAGSEVVKPSSKEDYEHQRSQSLKPARPPPPMHNYENESGSLRAPTRPEPTYRGSLHKH